jgi:hypothetical protein
VTANPALAIPPASRGAVIASGAKGIGFSPRAGADAAFRTPACGSCMSVRAAVDDQGGSGHEARTLGSEERDRFGDLVGNP